MIELRVKNRDAQVTLIPTAAAHVIKAMAEPARDRKKQKIRKVHLFYSYRKAPSQFDYGASRRNSYCNET